MMMAKQGVSTVVPRLRFPEFRKAGSWEEHALKQLATEFLDGDWIESKDQSESGFRLVQTGNIGVGVFIEKSGKTRYISAETFVRLRCTEVFPGDCLVSRLPDPAGRSCLLPDIGARMITAVDCTVVRFDEKKIIPSLFIAHSQTENYFREVAALSSGSTRQRISRENLSSLPVFLPNIDEQQKIADCLTSLDEVIAAQGRKVEALKAHKRGLMQQLFPREGETRPRLRFPEFRSALEWITRPLGELMVIGSSKRVHESDWTTTGIPFYRAREIVAIGKGKPINPLFISKDLYTEFTGFTGEIEEGQLLVTGVGSIGIPYLVKSDDRFYFKDGNIIWLKNSQADLSGDFLLRLFESDYVQGQIATMAGVGTVGTYTIENAKRTIAIFPVDKREQQRIADCLTSLDTQIAAEVDQLAALRNHKQGLMQQLFPAPETTSA